MTATAYGAYASESQSGTWTFFFWETWRTEQNRQWNCFQLYFQFLFILCCKINNCNMWKCSYSIFFLIVKSLDWPRTWPWACSGAGGYSLFVLCFKVILFHSIRALIKIHVLEDQFNTVQLTSVHLLCVALIIVSTSTYEHWRYEHQNWDDISRVTLPRLCYMSNQTHCSFRVWRWSTAKSIQLQ